MKKTRSTLLLATLWIATPVLAAQVDPAEKAVDARENRDTQAFLARIAKAQLILEVEGEPKAAERELEKIRDEVMLQAETAPDSFDATAVLLELTLARVNVLLEQGEADEALAGLEETVNLDRAKKVSSSETRAWRIALALAARKDFRITELMRKLDNEEVTSASQTVDDLVHQFAAANQFNQIYQLGARAVPALKARILANLDQFSAGVGTDELAILVQIDEVAAGELVLAHLGEGGTLWRGRIVRAMNYAPGQGDGHGVLGQHRKEAWEYSSGFPCNCRRAHWVKVLEQLTKLPDVSADAIRMVRSLVRHGAITPKLEDALIQALRSNEPKRVQAALYALDSPYWAPGVERALEVAVAHESAHVRVFAANQLARHEASAALQTRVTDPEAGVRRALARTLTIREEQYPVVAGDRLSYKEKDFYPTLGAAERAILAQFATDPDVQVRGYVVDALQLLDTPPDTEMIMQLVADPDAGIRARMAKVARSLPPEFRAKVLLALTADENRSVLSAVDDALANDDWAQPELLLPVLRARQVHPAQSIATGRRWGTVLDSVTPSDRGLNQLVDWAVEDRDVDLLEKILRDSLLRVDAERMGRMLPFLFEVDGKACAKYVDDIRREGAEADHFRPALLELARNEALSPGLRFLAASCMATEGGEVLVAVMEGTLRDPGYWATERRKGRNGFYAMVDDVLERIPPADRNRIILAVVTDGASDSELAALVANEFAWEGPLADAIAKEILGRWFVVSPGHAARTVRSAITRMGSYPASADLDILAQALDRVEYRRVALGAIGMVHPPSLLPKLAQLLGNPGDKDWAAALEAVTNYMNDDAAALLLDAATGAGSQEARNSCLSSLNAIRNFQDTRNHFATRRASRQTRDGAVADLIVMLDDENTEVRIQAIRALATFESVESIPLLIRMLPKADEATTTALRETLDRLNGIAKAGEK